MSEAWLEVNGLDRRFGGVLALSRFSCSIKPGELVGLIGPNGAGKTTLFNVLTGFIPAQQGKAVFKGKKLLGKAPHQVARAGISRTFQNVRLIRQISVLENVLFCFKNQPGESLFNAFFRWGLCKRVEARNVEVALALLNEAGLAEKAYDLADNLSYGQQKLLSITCCLAAEADLLLLDEPVAGIAPALIEKIVSIIREIPKRGKSVILIEHNMDVIRQICGRVIFMDAGVKVSEGTPEEVRNDPRVIEAYLD